ncbi:MAG: hypothetical protein ACXVPL_03040 [Actinomycetota bacterium]
MADANDRSATDRRRRVVGIVLAFVLVFAVIAVARSLTANVSTLGVDASARLPGMLTSNAPWPNNTGRLRDRLSILGLPPVGGFQHIHAYLAIVIDGRRVPVPADIGLATNAESPLHVHEGEPGIIHVESWSTSWRATLGEFFDVWGVRLSSTCGGGDCAGATRSLKVFVDGRPHPGDPRNLPLADHEVIVVTFGTPDEIPSPLPTFDWSRFGG